MTGTHNYNSNQGLEYGFAFFEYHETFKYIAPFEHLYQQFFIFANSKPHIMKKVIISLFLIATAGITVNFNANATCQEALPNQLRACILSSQLEFTVTVIGNTVYVHGTVSTSSGSGSSSGGSSGSGSTSGSASSAALMACIDEYNIGAASCPGAPTLVMATPSTANPGHTTGSAGRSNNL